MYHLPEAVDSFGGIKTEQKISNRTENVCNLVEGNNGMLNVLYS
jgi:hypothetical protein